MIGMNESNNKKLIWITKNKTFFTGLRRGIHNSEKRHNKKISSITVVFELAKTV